MKARPVLSATMRTVIFGSLILSAAAGVRQTFGLYIQPFSIDHGLPVTEIAFAIALHNLVWGLSQPLIGAVADRTGPGPVVAFGALLYALALLLAALEPTGGLLILSMGVMVGLGISCTSFGVVMTAVGRSAPPEKRSMALGLASAGGSVGQVLLVPLAQGVTEHAGLSLSLLTMAACLLAVAPLGFLLDHKPAEPSGAAPLAVPSLRTILGEASRHPGYRLLTLGFFTCGFQLAFISTHLPPYLALCHLPSSLGASALALIGLFNIFGSWACGWLGSRFPQQYVLGWLYLVRALTILAFLAFPKSGATVVIFAALLGLTWLGTLPLTSGLVARIFGVGNLGALFGICFLSHQVGSFLGAWAGGYLFDVTGSYSLIWTITVMLGLGAAALHFCIRENRVPELPGAAAPAE